ncbi:putative P450 monooxygenase [Halenospora varia]|nr:putative P450 monooxygenase [Halenospora varia]
MPYANPTLLQALLALAVATLSHAIYGYVTDPLRSVPGPFLARFTRLWELFAVRRRNWHKEVMDLHATYGPIVRVAPNRYSFSDPSVMKTIYGHGSKFSKSPFYLPFGHPDHNAKDLFSQINSDKHARDRRKVASLYSMTNLLTYEAFVDEVNEKLCNQLLTRSENRSTVCIPKWMQFYAFDVIGHITVAEPFGFLENGHDDERRILGAIHEMTVSSSQIGLFHEIVPFAARFVQRFKIPIPQIRLGTYIQSHIDARKSGKVDDQDIHTTIGSNIAAGSDTTAISLSSVIYHLCRHPDALIKLRKEIDDFAADGTISNPVTFQESQKMPYLQAVIKEALRKHSVVDQPLWHVVPAGGAQMSGRFFPEGTVVGVSPWSLHYNKDIFGPDVKEFRPERWLIAESASLEKSLFSFGAGSRTCVGKNISLLELNKVIPQMYRKFNFVLSNPSKEWEVKSGWFTKQLFDCQIEARQPPSV